VQHLKDIAQAARFQAMKPGRLIDQHTDTDAQAFESAAFWADTARLHRQAKALGGCAFTPGQHEAKARKAERRVRAIALQSEILLARRADQLPAGPCHQPMLNILMGAAA